jgi:hypothetical protein
MSTEHRLTLEPQPIADQWMAKCSCGWRKAVSLYEHAHGWQAREAARKAHEEHVQATVKPTA